jgi:hypothetical protein
VRKRGSKSAELAALAECLVPITLSRVQRRGNLILLPVQSVGNHEPKEIIQIAPVALPGRLASDAPAPQADLDQERVGLLDQTHPIGKPMYRMPFRTNASVASTSLTAPPFQRNFLDINT